MEKNPPEHGSGHAQERLQQILTQAIQKLKTKFHESKELQLRHTYARLKEVYDEFVSLMLKHDKPNSVLVGKYLSGTFINFLLERGGENLLAEATALIIGNNPETPKKESEFEKTYGILIQQMNQKLNIVYDTTNQNEDDYIRWKIDQLIQEYKNNEDYIQDVLHNLLGWKEYKKLSEDESKQMGQVLMDMVRKFEDQK